MNMVLYTTLFLSLLPLFPPTFPPACASPLSLLSLAISSLQAFWWLSLLLCFSFSECVVLLAKIGFESIASLWLV